MIVFLITFIGVNFIFIPIKNIMSQFKLVLHYDVFKMWHEFPLVMVFNRRQRPQ